MYCDKEKLIPEDSLRAVIEKASDKSGSQKKNTQSFFTKVEKIFFKPFKTLFKIFDRRNTTFLFIFILIMCVKSLEGRPNVIGLQSVDVKEGNTADTTQTILTSLSSLSSVAKESESPTTISAIGVAEPEGEAHTVQRYRVSQVDFQHVKTPFIIAAWILTASLAKIVFHMTPQLHKYVPESCLLIVVGVLVGIVMFFSTNVFVSPLTPDTFFLYMLPPIILDAGYFMPNRMFFDNLGTILLMAVVGTIFNTATIGLALWLCGLTGIFGVDNTPGFLDIFLFTSLIAAVDPVAVLAVFEEIKVDEMLYIIVFGESLLNDAVTVVMYHMMEAYDELGVDNIIAQDIVSGVASFFVVALGGTIIGIIWGFLLGFVTRFTNHVRIIEPIFVFLMSYLSYLNAEMFHMSGILAITFCGIVSKNYVESNISPKSQTTIKYALKMLANSSETIIFMFLGVATVHSTHDWNTWFVLLTVLFCCVFRTLGVIMFAALANRYRLHKLGPVDQFVMSYGGLRGAVAFALVLLIDERVVKHKNMFVTTTMAVIYFTVFLQGFTIKPLVELLNVKRASKKDLTMNERINERFIDHVMAGLEDIIGHNNGNYNVRDKFRRINDRFIRPYLIRNLESAERKFIKTYSELVLKDAMVIMQRSRSSLGFNLETNSMTGSFRNYSANISNQNSDFRESMETTFSKNMDVNETDYFPSKRDIFDAEIHHLSAEQYRPYKSRPQNIGSKSRAIQSSSKTDDRTSKIRFRRYITNRRHLKFLQIDSDNNSDKAQQSLVSFSDERKKTKFPQVVRIAGPKIQVHDADDDDGGLVFESKKKAANNNNISQSSSIGDNMGNFENNNSEFPWRHSNNSAKSPIRSEKIPDWNESGGASTGNKSQDYLENIATSLPYIDSTSTLDTTSNQNDNTETGNSDSSTNDDFESVTEKLLSDELNGAKHPVETDTHTIVNYDVPMICKDLEVLEMRELNEELCLPLSSSSLEEYENHGKIVVTTTLLSRSSTKYGKDGEFDR